MISLVHYNLYSIWGKIWISCVCLIVKENGRQLFIRMFASYLYAKTFLIFAEIYCSILKRKQCEWKTNDLLQGEKKVKNVRDYSPGFESVSLEVWLYYFNHWATLRRKTQNTQKWSQDLDSKAPPGREYMICFFLNKKTVLRERFPI